MVQFMGMITRPLFRQVFPLAPLTRMHLSLDHLLSSPVQLKFLHQPFQGRVLAAAILENLTTQIQKTVEEIIMVAMYSSSPIVDRLVVIRLNNFTRKILNTYNKPPKKLTPTAVTLLLPITITRTHATAPLFQVKTLFDQPRRLLMTMVG
jgi:hypothetical protein